MEPRTPVEPVSPAGPVTPIEPGTPVRRVGWLDLSAGVSGDMLLGALVSAGADLATMARAVDAVGLPVHLRRSAVSRAGLAATKIDVETDPEPAGTARPWREIRRLLTTAPLEPGVRDQALEVFAVLARAEGAVHGVGVDDVHFHEVGGLDAVADVVGVVAGFAALRLDTVVATPLALGGGTVRTAHGALPVPGPAVLELLRAAGAPAFGGPVEVELCTPTGAALVTTIAGSYGPMPPMVAEATGVGAGRRDLPGRPNVVRLVVGPSYPPVSGPAHDQGPSASAPATEGPALLLETNVDDLDPRAWPEILAVLLAGGASDAWLTPILMKKGRPAHTLAVLVTPERADGIRRLVFHHTPTLGVRETVVGKRTLARGLVPVEVAGQPIVVKVATLPDGTIANAQPEWSDVRRAAEALGQPVRSVLAEAVAAALAAGLAPGHLPPTHRAPTAHTPKDERA
ncbi:MAG: nickel pincer cofactor biosynthesis protein LarC [Frankia sp.]